MGIVRNQKFFWIDKEKRAARIECPYCHSDIEGKLEVENILQCSCGKKFRIIEEPKEN